jgi:hypothetical protein
MSVTITDEALLPRRTYHQLPNTAMSNENSTGDANASGQQQREVMPHDPLRPTHPFKPRNLHPESIETYVTEIAVGSEAYRAKRRDSDSDRQPLTHIITPSGRTLCKYAGENFSDWAVRAICAAHARGLREAA